MLFVPALLFSQTRKQRKALAAQKKADLQIINNLKIHSQNLANKNSTGKDGEKTIEYISNQFKTIGLQPKGANGYIEQFKIDEGKQVEAKTFLKVNGVSLRLKKEYTPLSYSAEKSVSGMPVMALKEKGVPWFTDVKEWLEEDSQNPSFDIDNTVQKEAARAASKGATALFLYNSSNLTDSLRINNKVKAASLSIPVIYITREGYNKYFIDQSQVLDVELNVAFKDSIRNAVYATGHIDNGAASNIIIATPYNRLDQQENDSIADNRKINDTNDIISGPSVLVELARILIASKAKNNNYTFIAYSGRDILDEGSKWINNSASPINYIINLNRVGRYDNDKKLLIEGYGIPPGWLETIKPIADKTLELSYDSRNLKGIDTTNYRVRVPILNFFTAMRDNKASDTEGKINYEGELHIVRFISRLIEATDTKGKLAFAENTTSEFPNLKTSQPAASSQETARP